MGRPSPSSRRAWIEITDERTARSQIYVALLAEGVDRNVERPAACPCAFVALLAEGVDRNSFASSKSPLRSSSPSSRRAWIEMLNALSALVCCQVALLAEGVDRNLLALLRCPG